VRRQGDCSPRLDTESGSGLRSDNLATSYEPRGEVVSASSDSDNLSQTITLVCKRLSTNLVLGLDM
jgi:hypothetical protein